ncbi:MAG TPA: solute carrier family 23 protein [Solirubrobacterales bacterium]|nr:solute carrier family 23 protein [Solirubrobacterales bacterium]
MSVASIRAPRLPRLAGRDLADAALWVAVLVPSSFGFWLVAGDLAGVPAADQRTLVLASLLAVGMATLCQVAVGYRMPVFEGPASTYLGAIAVLAASAGGADPAQATGGLLAAGALVFALGAVGADRLLSRIFTPAVLVSFLLIVVVTVVPATVERAIGRSGGHPLGALAAWASAIVVVAVALGGRWLPRLRPFSLLAALILGTGVYFAFAGLPGAAVGGGWTLPQPFPWGAPVFSFPVVLPFLIAGALASLNTIASINAMAEACGEPPPPGAARRGLASHGAIQALTSCFGNVLGNVPRLDSVGVVRMLGTVRPQALGLAAAAILVLAFVGPAVDLLAQIPIAVSAALLAVVLGMLADQGLRQLTSFDWRRRWLVVAPSVVPTFAWLLFADQLSEEAQLFANPLLIGTVLAVVLDRVVPHGRAPKAMG